MGQPQGDDGIAAECMIDLFGTGNEENEAVWIRQMVAATLLYEGLAEIKNTRRQISAFLRALANAK